MPTKRHPRKAVDYGSRAVPQHERIIRALIDADPRMYRNGFWQAVDEIVKAEGLDPNELVQREFRPDAYLIDHTRKHINIFEVEVTHALTERKKDDYAWWWFLWDCETEVWTPRLFVVNRYGHGHELGLKRMYYGKIAREADAARAAASCSATHLAGGR